MIEKVSTGETLMFTSVTETDREVESVITRHIREKYPDSK